MNCAWLISSTATMSEVISIKITKIKTNQSKTTFALPPYKTKTREEGNNNKNKNHLPYSRLRCRFFVVSVHDAPVAGQFLEVQHAQRQDDDDDEENGGQRHEHPGHGVARSQAARGRVLSAQLRQQIVPEGHLPRPQATPDANIRLRMRAGHHEVGLVPVLERREGFLGPR